MDMLERFAVTYKNDGLPPLVGKIIGLLYINNQKYFTFSDIQEGIGASKGATSKALKLLLGLNRINFKYSDENKKKRLFFLDIKGVYLFMKIVMKNYSDQNQLLKESLDLRNNENEELNGFINESIKFNEEVLDFLNKKSIQYFKE
ncbi:GbsR/MarR family transcriptional regulator [Lutibacter holmesii]|uniref:GbsR/MarR family transcriptional regulator n=1 Tax=Lutibacter holmesii TaxID=1137985 RepID=A0ABW3WJC0_9FLAO